MQTPPPPVGARRSRGRASYSHARGPRLGGRRSTALLTTVARHRAPPPFPSPAESTRPWQTEQSLPVPAAGTIPLFSVCGFATSIRRATALAWRGRRPEPPTLQRPAALLRESAVRPRVRRGAAPRSQCIARSSLHPRRTPHSFGCHSGSDQREPVSVREMMPMARCRLSLRRCRKYEDIFVVVFKLNFVVAGRGTAGAATEPRPRSRGRERLAPYGVRPLHPAGRTASAGHVHASFSVSRALRSEKCLTVCNTCHVT